MAQCGLMKQIHFQFYNICTKNEFVINSDPSETGIYTPPLLRTAWKVYFEIQYEEYFLLAVIF